MVFEGFPLFYKYFIFSIKKKPLGGLKGRREKVKPCARLLWCKSGPTPLISAEPLWICQSADERDPSAKGACVARGGSLRGAKAEKADELGFLCSVVCSLWKEKGVKPPPEYWKDSLFRAEHHADRENSRGSGGAQLTLYGVWWSRG